MEFSTLIATISTIAVSVLVPLWLQTASAISRNGREVSELRGRIGAMERTDANLLDEVGAAHRRIGAIGRTTDGTAGEVRQMRSTLAVVQEVLVRGEGTPANER